MKVFLSLDMSNEFEKQILVYSIENKKIDLNKALLTASREGHIDIVQLLLETGKCDMDYQKNEYTALMLASYNGRTDIVQLLLDAEADVNARNENDKTALMIAEKESHKKIIDLLKT